MLVGLYGGRLRAALVDIATYVVNNGKVAECKCGAARRGQERIATLKDHVSITDQRSYPSGSSGISNVRKPVHVANPQLPVHFDITTVTAVVQAKVGERLNNGCPRRVPPLTIGMTGKLRRL